MSKLSDAKFKFKESLFLNRFDKIDWKHIASVDVQQMKVNVSWETIEKNVRNILCCHLETEFEHCNVDPNLKKLYQLAQVTIECLIQLQFKTSHELELCQEKLQAKKMILDSFDKSKEEYEKQIKELKRENKKMGSQSQYYRCPNCPKTFLNGEYLLGHWQRRHPEVMLRTAAVNPPTPIIMQPNPISNTQISPHPPLELEELKLRLQVAEQQLQQEQQLLVSINEKMDLTDRNLQGVLVQEVEKLRRDILEQRVESPSKKTLESSSVQTSPRLSRAPSVTAVNEHADSVKSVTIETGTGSNDVSPPARSTTPPTPAMRTIIQPKLVKLIAEAPKEVKQDSDDPSISSLLGTDDEKEPVKAPKQSVISKPQVEIDRKILAERFRSTIKYALAQRLLKFGLDLRKTNKLGEEKFKQVSHDMKGDRPKTEEFISLRKKLKKEVRKSMVHDGKKRKSHRHQPKTTTPPKIIPLPIKAETLVSKVASPIRAPIPAPRSKPPASGHNLMARDGEATSVSLKPVINYKEIQNQTFIVKERSATPEPIKHQSPDLPREAPEKEQQSNRKQAHEEDSDSFSFSSLDAILSELKRPQAQMINYSPSVSNPGTQSVKSVQWREPVETVAPLDDSWGI